MPRPTSRELVQRQAELEMIRKDKLSETGCLMGHCYHAFADPKCRGPHPKNMIARCCRCPYVE